VGKTFLLTHFVRERRSLFFGATQQAEAVELARLAEAVRIQLGDRTADLTGGAFGSWESALRALAALASDRALAVVLDEVPYLARSTRGFASIVQVLWDHLPPGTKLMLVLTGSAIGTIEEMLGAHGPLRGRPSVAMRVDPLDPQQARVFLPRLARVRYLEAYAACGGYPLHLRSWNARASTRENLLHLAATAGGVLLEDARSMLLEELTDAVGYGRVLAAVGRGKTRYGEIANEAGQRVEAAIETLIRGGFLRKSLPVGAPKGARPSYELSDPYVAFWFSCLFGNETAIEGGQGTAVLVRVAPLWQRHVGWVFEEAARAHAARLVARGTLPRELVVGRWWTATGPQCEVDVLGLRGRHTALVGEARWASRPFDDRDVFDLRRKLERVPSPVASPLLAFWSIRGPSAATRRARAVAFSLADILAA